MLTEFIVTFKNYLIEILPALAFGFFISGIIYELIPTDWISNHLGKKGFLPIFYATVVGTLLPVCCWGSLPIGVSFYKKGARLGPILAFLVATPATSVSALFVSYKLLGLVFTVYIFFAVIIMGVIMGIIGNLVRYKPNISVETCPECEKETQNIHTQKKSILQRICSILKYAFYTLPKEIGLEIFVGILLASVVATFVPIGQLIHKYLFGWLGYVFSVIFGLIMYICSTASVPLVDALIKQGMNIGAGMTLLLIGPITSYGTILVLRKEFGFKLLFVFLATIIVTSLLLGWGFFLVHR